MKIRKEIGMNGKEVFFLTPENEADIHKIESMHNISSNNSFGDWKGPYQRVNKHHGKLVVESVKHVKKVK